MNPLTLREYLEIEQERKGIVNSMEYAYAMGHGCSTGGRDPRLQPVVDRAEQLSKQLREAREEAMRDG